MAVQRNGGTGKTSEGGSAKGHGFASDALFRSFWMGGFEGADHFNRHGRALDMAVASDHIAQADGDYARLAALGVRTVRESLGWRLAESADGAFDFGRLVHLAEAAHRHGIQIVWTLMHYGTPSGVGLLDDALVDRFARFANAVAQRLATLPRHGVPVINPINEIGFIAWAASATADLSPYPGPDWLARGEAPVVGYGIKCRLVRAALAAQQAISRVLPAARFLHIEPLVHVAAPHGQPEHAAFAAQVRGYQWQTWDLLAGLAEPQLGGSPRALDLVGVNHYHDSQWEVPSDAPLWWHLRDTRRLPLAHLLEETWQRYGRPLVVAETSHVGIGRAAWLHDTAFHVQAARRRGVPVSGICLYPVVDRHDWNDEQRWHRSGLFDIEGRSPGLPLRWAAPGTRSGAPASTPPAHRPPLARRLDFAYAKALRRWQRRLPTLLQRPRTMTHLVVFSHLRWDFVHQRPQHLLTRLARFHSVLLVEEPMHDPGPARMDAWRAADNVQVLRPRTPLAAPGFHATQLPVIARLLDEHLRLADVTDYVAWFYTPMALPLLEGLAPRAVVYDCMDELSAFDQAPDELVARELALFEAADLVFTGGPSLYEAKRGLHANLHCFPSAVDAAHYAPSAARAHPDRMQHAEALQGAIAHPRLGFFGVIDERFDQALLARMADAEPQWQFVMVGPVAKIDAHALPQRPNIHWLGQQPYELLPQIVAGWDVCLMPFAINRATRFISPTKTLEYMAAGKPVVSTPIVDVQTLYGDVVDIARDADGFVAACRALLARSPEEARRHAARMAQSVTRYSWAQTAGQMHALIAATLRTRSPRSTRQADQPAGLPMPTVNAPAC